MKSRRLDLSELCRQGIVNSDTRSNVFGNYLLSNMRTDGTQLHRCPTESTTKISGTYTPFTLGTVDYYIKSDGVYNSSGTKIHSRAFTGDFYAIKIVNLIKVVWIQDTTATLYVDADGVYTVNPSGNTTPIANDICVMNGQIIMAGIVSGISGLDQGYVAWSEIGGDDFTLTKQNDAGCYHPNIGTLLAVKPLQDSAILFGTRGACQMYYAGHVFGFRDLDIPLLKSGVLSASSTNEVLYMNSYSELIKVDKNGVGVVVGYGWLRDSAIAWVRYFNGRNLFAVCDGTYTYLIDSKGMFTYSGLVHGEFNSTLAVASDFTQTAAAWTTCYSDLGLRGLKMLTEIFLSGASSLSAYAYGDTLGTPGAKTFNSQDAVKYPLTSKLFRFYFTHSGSYRFRNFQIELNLMDKRFGVGSLPYTGGNRNVN